MVYTFGSMDSHGDGAIDAADCREVRGFAAYSGEDGYCISTRPRKRIKLTDVDARILCILARFPLLPPGCIEDVAGKGAAKRAAELYQAGILSRFAEKEGMDGGFAASVYYISENGIDLIGKGARSMGFPAGSVEEMSVPKRIEVSVLSRWLAYTDYFYDGCGAVLESYARPDRAHPYLEAVMHKEIRTPWYKRNIRCRFHILCRPRERDAMPLFMETLVYFEGLARQEEQEMADGCARSFVVVLCGSDDSMERLALELDLVFRAGGAEDTPTHFLYSLESDAMDGLGAFKFLSGISFPEGMVRRQQVAFK